LADHFRNLVSQFDDDGILQVLETIENGSEG